MKFKMYYILIIFTLLLISLLFSCQPLEKNYINQELISKITSRVKSIDKREIIIKDLQDNIKNINKSSDDITVLDERVEFLINPEHKLEEISNSENGTNQLIYIDSLFSNDIEHLEEAMGNVSQEMLQSYKEAMQEIENKSIKTINLAKTPDYTNKSSKATNLYIPNDSDITYSRIMSSIATAAAITVDMGILLGEFLPCLKALVPVANVAFISTVGIFAGIFVIKPDLADGAAKYFIVAFNCISEYSLSKFNTNIFHDYLLLNSSSNENIVNRYLEFFGVWDRAIAIYFAIPILKYILEKIPDLFKVPSVNEKTKKFYYTIKNSIWKSLNNNLQIDKSF